MSTKGKTVKDASEELEQDQTDDSNAILTKLMQDFEHAMVNQTSGGNWFELTQKPLRTGQIVGFLNKIVTTKGYQSALKKGENARQTLRIDTNANLLNTLIETVNQIEMDEEPIVGRFKVGTTTLSTNVSEFNKAMFDMKVPIKLGVRKNTDYQIVKIQKFI